MTSPSPTLAALHVDVAVIGAGTAGLAAYRNAVAQGARAVLIEAGPGGTLCAREGCMPSKLLISAAEAAHRIEDAHHFGVHGGPPRVDGPAVLRRVRAERDRFVGFVHAGVRAIPEQDRISGRARFVGPGHLRVDERLDVHARAVVIATGSQPLILPILRELGDRLITSRDVFEWPDLPDSVIVFGPGAIGLELGQALHRLGVRVRVVGVGGFLGPLTDPVVKKVATQAIAQELPLDTDAQVTRAWRDQDRVYIARRVDGEEVVEDFAYALSAVGRAPDLSSLGLEAAGLRLDRGRLRVDPHTMQLGDHPIFVAGDATGDRPLLHEAADEGRIAGANAARYPRVEPGDRRSLLGLVFTDPQLAVVGATWAELQGRDVVVGAVDLSDQGRSRVMRENRGWLHVYAEQATGRLLGAELAHPRAEHLAHLLAWSHQLGLTIPQMLDLPFYHPVVEEGLRTALRDAHSKLLLAPVARSA
ncbi:dihydrolipoyl dehydrogenase [Myxococcota bacterium]|nr:dihydrolipoyl dehydrogenase [Myxococcota bacterium]